jgi:ribosomal protein L40E
METPRGANLTTDQPAHTDDADEGFEPLPTLTGPLRCAAHPRTETYLRCGKCEKPICPRCMIQTPVGARCRQCAGLRRLPMFDVRPLDLVKGFLSAVAASAAGGMALLYLSAMPGVGFFGFILMALLGYGVGEAASAAARRRRSRTLGWATVLALPIGLVLGRAAFFVMVGGYPAQLAVATATAMLFAPIWSVLLLALAMWIAYQRVT